MSTRGCGRLSERIVLSGNFEKLTADRWVTRTLGIEASLPRCVAIALSFRRLARLHGGYNLSPVVFAEIIWEEAAICAGARDRLRSSDHHCCKLPSLRQKS